MSITTSLSTFRKPKAIDKLAEHQQEKTRKKVLRGSHIVPTKWTEYDALELLESSIALSPKYKGLYAQAYAEYGFEIGAKVIVDFGSMLGYLFSLKIKGGVSGAVLKEVMIMIHRAFPEKILDLGPPLPSPKSSVSPPPLPPDPNAPPLPPDSASVEPPLPTSPEFAITNKPISMMVFTGRNGTFSVAIEASVELGPKLFGESNVFGIANPSYSLDFTGFEASVSNETSVDFLFISEKSPGWYESMMDIKLRQDYRNTLLLGFKRIHKQEVVDWLRGHFEPNILAKKKPQVALISELRGLIQALPYRTVGKRLKDRQNPFRNPSSEDINSKLERILNILNSLDLVKNFGFSDDEVKSLQNNITFFIKSIGEAKKLEKDIKSIEEAKKLENDLDATKLFPPKKTGAVIFSEEEQKRFEKLSFISLNVFNPIDAQATVKAGFMPFGTQQKGHEDATPLADPSFPGAALFGTINYAYVRMASVFQTFTKQLYGIMPLVLTQKVKVRYHRTMGEFKGEMNLNFYAGGKLIDKSKNIGKKFINNTMTYRAVTAYWELPETAAQTKVLLKKGSGVSFGASYSIIELENILKGVIDGSIEFKLAYRKITKNLRLPIEVTKKFLHYLNQYSLDHPTEWENLKKNYPYIFLESSFRFSQYPHFEANKQDKLKNLFKQEAIKGFDDGDITLAKFNTYPLELDTIKLRYRLSDGIEDISSFTLGVTVLGIGSAFSFTKISRAGNEGMLDYLVYWPGVQPETETERKKYLEQAVPSPILLPHTFKKWAE